ncbi:MAG: hypothetical protein AAB794_00550 [Patescibacteria group bacterium]
MKELEKVTYVIEYIPSCRMKYLVRLMAPGTRYIDKLPPQRLSEKWKTSRKRIKAGFRSSNRADVQVIGTGRFERSGPKFLYGVDCATRCGSRVVAYTHERALQFSA